MKMNSNSYPDNIEGPEMSTVRELHCPYCSTFQKVDIDMHVPYQEWGRNRFLRIEKTGPIIIDFFIDCKECKGSFIIKCSDPI